MVVGVVAVSAPVDNPALGVVLIVDFVEQSVLGTFLGLGECLLLVAEGCSCGLVVGCPSGCGVICPWLAGMVRPLGLDAGSHTFRGAAG